MFFPDTVNLHMNTFFFAETVAGVFFQDLAGAKMAPLGNFRYSRSHVVQGLKLKTCINVAQARTKILLFTQEFRKHGLV